MNNHLLTLFVVTLACASTLATAETAPPASELTTWTSNDDRTIRARFLGVGVGSVLIEKDGAVFVVPFARLSPQSVAQAKKLGGFTEKGVGAKPQGPSTLSATTKAGSDTPTVIATTSRVLASLPQGSYARMASVSSNSGAASFPATPRASGIELQGRVAAATVDVPTEVHHAIDAGNILQTKGYKYGGGRSPLEDTGYDCSGSVSYVLIKAGLLDEPRTSRSFATYGEAGPGKWLTIYAGPGHVFMTVCGLRLDTGGRGGMGTPGPRWNPYPRYGASWTVRHPPGF